jgi:putative colanic acid biosynthesis UDP-glucose lipid carrier transferase
MENINNNPGYCYHLEEYITDEQIHQKSSEELCNALQEKMPDEIYVCYKEMDLGLLDKLIHLGEKNDLNINVVFDIILDTVHNMFKYENYPILRINPNFKTSRKVEFLKRGFDLFFASFLMIGGIPIFLVLLIITKLSSKGPAFYRQERIGKDEKPFYIYKFRSMYVNAEASGPQLSKENDPRITKWGKIMRKTRLDELPQFWNVLKGEMSIVGYRPERKYFIEEITKKVPDYKSLFYHKPGITSLGQIHYGYAENVDQMCERSRFDLLYIRNRNLVLDISIIMQTIRVMVQGKGK